MWIFKCQTHWKICVVPHPTSFVRGSSLFGLEIWFICIQENKAWARHPHCIGSSCEPHIEETAKWHFADSTLSCLDRLESLWFLRIILRYVIWRPPRTTVLIWHGPASVRWHLSHCPQTPALQWSPNEISFLVFPIWFETFNSYIKSCLICIIDVA